MPREDRTFYLGGASLYIGGGCLSEEELESSSHYAGPTDGGITVTFGSDLYEIRDETGEVKETVRRNESVTVKGRLAKFQARTLSALTDCPYTDDEKKTTVYLGGRGGEKKPRELSLLFLCPLGKSQQFRLFLRCRVEAGGSFTLGKDNPGRLAFSVLAKGKDIGEMTFREVAV